ncbi:hypothetical protein [Kitasatospora azatica]|uniref:hypothetical protein n=1 Tax=Kitasatospora azatica TaxID=58347 RepID=UPI00055D1BB3|nr:hypothetical protein [Kitasatospora azatica]
MGGTGWTYRTRWRGSIAASLEALKLDVLAAGDYQHSPTEDETPPATIEELMALLESEDDDGMLAGGTHSILDLYEISDPAALAADQRHRTYYHRLYPLAEHEVLELFASPRPTLADWERIEQLDEYRTLSPARWMGRCTVLYAADQPDQIVFWGSSGY